ncbi:hypothetical protein CSM33_002499 [Salmonella enterica subsp. diarizonae]|uniref:DUF6201 family protein n=1 Tax=Salmonella enterica TaxID=28901 RepID=UPI00111A74B8|nr:DUF6201 family protein [Salmonella enterica]ECF6079136.1 hypothetical protein [Salmonella enterica subsp. diarizonae]EDQ4425230.1 hypothetical protein [Salmonella enterica subsp. salamae]EHJ8506089.1 hypothetical protein [Salmonella enterica subsp. diarizonae serovar 47:k:z53:[z84]]WGI48170.1 DUF6201 family protein [Salmonella enterica subsp. diarizonae serovar 48:i:z]ECG8553929.1 hypothetical protein [Salmonella enterica subsp. diarizonae]
MSKTVIFVILLFIWFIFFTCSIFGKFNYIYEKASQDGQFKIVAYDILPTTPYAAYQNFICNDIFLVLYDKKGKYLGQSSPFHFSEFDGVFADAVFFQGIFLEITLFQ